MVATILPDRRSRSTADCTSRRAATSPRWRNSAIRNGSISAAKSALPTNATKPSAHKLASPAPLLLCEGGNAVSLCQKIEYRFLCTFIAHRAHVIATGHDDGARIGKCGGKRTRGAARLI